jgi:hypothetical protein
VLSGLLVTVLPSSAYARVATIRTTAPIAEPSEVSVQAALVEAVEAATRGALAMGLPRVALSQAFLLPGVVLVEVVATDGEDEEDADVDEVRTPAGGPDR